MDRRIIEISHRLAAYEELSDDIDPNFQKIRNIIQMKIKNLMKDLLDAVKDENDQLTVGIMHMIMNQFEEIYKYLGLREFKVKLDNIVDNEFGDDIF